MAAKVGWIESALTSAGRPTDAIELQFSVYLCKIGRNGRANQRVMSTFADDLAVREDLVGDSPSVLIGSLDECEERLEARRARFGFATCASATTSTSSRLSLSDSRAVNVLPPPRPVPLRSRR